jgi:hypothetical protein
MGQVMNKKPNFFATLTKDEREELLANDLVLEGELLLRFWRMEEFNSPIPRRFDLMTQLEILVDKDGNPVRGA